MSETTVRRCKKCGCELVSTNKHKLCDDCRRDRNHKIGTGIKAGGAVLFSALVLVVTKGKFGGKKS